MTYKLMAIDIDGTLLNDEQKITPKNIQMIQAAMHKGTKIVLCTGRDYQGAISNANRLGLKGSDEYMIYFGGSRIQNFDGKVIYQKTLAETDAIELINFFTVHKIRFDLIDSEGVHSTSYQTWAKRSAKNPDLKIIKFLLTTNEEDLAETAALLHVNYDQSYFTVQTSATELELFPKGINKGTALTYLANYLQIDLADVVAVGDMDNDIPMLKRVGLSVAMGNAIIAVKKICDIETADNNHSGVAQVISNYVL
jgi:HAD-superfamily hydrolase, subfamily IIB